MGMIDGIVGLSISIILLANVFISTVKTTNTTGLNFSASELALWSVITLAGIIGVVYSTLRIFGVMGGA